MKARTRQASKSSMYQLNGERAELYASMDAGDSTAFMRLASASSVVGAERLRDLDFLGFSEAVTDARGELLGRDLPSRSEFSFSTSLMSKSARRPSSDALRLLKNQSKLNLRGNQPMSRVDGEA